MAKKAAKKKATHGGKREGAGRPVSEEKKQIVSVRLPGDVIEFMQKMKKTAKLNQTDAIIHAVRTCPDYEKHMGD